MLIVYLKHIKIFFCKWTKNIHCVLKKYSPWIVQKNHLVLFKNAQTQRTNVHTRCWEKEKMHRVKAQQKRKNGQWKQKGKEWRIQLRKKTVQKPNTKTTQKDAAGTSERNNTPSWPAQVTLLVTVFASIWRVCVFAGDLLFPDLRGEKWGNMHLNLWVARPEPGPKNPGHAGALFCSPMYISPRLGLL